MVCSWSLSRQIPIGNCFVRCRKAGTDARKVLQRGMHSKFEQHLQGCQNWGSRHWGIDQIHMIISWGTCIINHRNTGTYRGSAIVTITWDASIWRTMCKLCSIVDPPFSTLKSLKMRDSEAMHITWIRQAKIWCDSSLSWYTLAYRQ